MDSIHNNKALYEKNGMFVKNKAIAFAFSKGTQIDRYGNLIYNLNSQYIRQVNNYLTGPSQALRLLSIRERQIKKNQKGKEVRHWQWKRKYGRKGRNNICTIIKNKDTRIFLLYGDTLSKYLSILLPNEESETAQSLYKM